ncbi:MAG TPA: Wzz/FepE/Etk N-terminal domain-containing protein, partial [Anseongella sp.]|nr:Wzz/FepE/Etk N-terminal domain-containing protein [Anseongella sp.]
MENRSNNGAAGAAPSWQQMPAEDVQISLNNLLRVLKSRWYWVLGTLLVSMAVCYLFLKVTQPEYRSQATLKYNSNDKSEVTEMSQMLFPDFGQNQQYLAEIYTLKSISLITRALDTMKHHFVFQAREGLRMANIYPQKPFDAEILYYNPDEFNRGDFSMTYGADALEINYLPATGLSAEMSFNLRQGDTVKVPGLQFALSEIRGVGHGNVSFSFIDFFAIKESLVNSLNIAEAEKSVPVLQASFTGNN